MKIRMRYYLSSVKIATINKTEINKHWPRKEIEWLHIAGRNVSQCSQCGKVWRFSQNTRHRAATLSSNPVTGEINPKK